jgi:hypothetical protein
MMARMTTLVLALGLVEACTSAKFSGISRSSGKSNTKPQQVATEQAPASGQCTAPNVPFTGQFPTTAVGFSPDCISAEVINLPQADGSNNHELIFTLSSFDGSTSLGFGWVSPAETHVSLPAVGTSYAECGYASWSGNIPSVTTDINWDAAACSYAAIPLKSGDVMSAQITINLVNHQDGSTLQSTVLTLSSPAQVSP